LRNPKFKEQKYKEMFMTILQAYPLLVQAGVPVNLKRVIEMWLEAAGVDDVDSVLLNAPIDSMGMQALAQAPGDNQLEQLVQGSQGGQGPQGLAGITAQTPGAPNSFGVQPPAEEANPDNSGMLAQMGLG
jgi:hypothetical protein